MLQSEVAAAVEPFLDGLNSRDSQLQARPGKKSLGMVTLCQTIAAHPRGVKLSWADSVQHLLGVGVVAGRAGAMQARSNAATLWLERLHPRLSSQRAVWRPLSVPEYSIGVVARRHGESLQKTYLDWRTGPSRA